MRTKQRSGKSVANRVFHRIPDSFISEGRFDGECERRLIQAGARWEGNLLMLRGDVVGATDGVYPYWSPMLP